MVTHRDFSVAGFQGTLFTPDQEFSSAKTLSAFFPEISDLLDAEPTVLPPFPGGVPGEIPRIIFQSNSRAWKCEIASARINVSWRRQAGQDGSMELKDCARRVTEVLGKYQTKLAMRIGRVAAIVNRFAKDPEPGVTLSRHFCNQRWLDAPLNRPENFELHAHKVFDMGKFKVNSWARCKTGHLSTDPSEKTILFEQDINTLAEHAKTKSFTNAEVNEFYDIVASEFDSILELYFPGDSQ